MQNESTGSEGRNWLITGANGNLGKRLITSLLAQQERQVVAVVRSENARRSIAQLALPPGAAGRLRIEVLDYTDEGALRAVAEGCDAAVHLVGILKATRAASYEAAHEASCTALTRALAGTSVRHLTYLSIVGSAPDAANACLASKGRAEQICLTAQVPSTVLRVPMVLGEGDYASFALRQRASKPLSFTFRADSLEQPIYAGDVVQAILLASAAGHTGALDLGGPEVLTRRALTRRAALVFGHSTRVVSLPLFLGMALAGLLEAVSSNPPVTRTMLEVLDHDDEVDSAPAMRQLGLDTLTALDDMLQQVLR